MKNAARLIYAAFGSLALALSLLALVEPSLVLPPDERSSLAVHLVREQAAAGLFIGVMALWCVFNLERRAPVHFALLLFTGVFAAVHWAEYFFDRRLLTSPLMNSVPFLAFLVITPFGTRDARADRPS